MYDAECRVSDFVIGILQYSIACFFNILVIYGIYDSLSCRFHHHIAFQCDTLLRTLIKKAIRLPCTRSGWLLV